MEEETEEKGVEESKGSEKVEGEIQEMVGEKEQDGDGDEMMRDVE